MSRCGQLGRFESDSDVEGGTIVYQDVDTFIVKGSPLHPFEETEVPRSGPNYNYLVTETARAAGMTKKDTKKVLDAFTRVVRGEVAKPTFEKLRLPNVGTFVKHVVPEQVGRGGRREPPFAHLQFHTSPALECDMTQPILRAWHPEIVVPLRDARRKFFTLKR